MARADEVTPSVRPADLRFVLPHPPSSAAVLGDLGGLADALGRVGVEARAVDARPDVVFADHASLPEALHSDAAHIVVVGRASTRLLQRHGYAARRHLVRWGARGPRVIVPLDSRAAVRWVILRERDGAVRRMVARALATPLAALLPSRDVLTVASRSPAPPFVVSSAPAGDFGGAAWALLLGEGDDLQRGVFVLVDASGSPRHALKLCRVPACAEALDRDADGLALVAGAGEAARHAPRLVARFDAGGTPVSMESAGRGGQLSTFLLSSAPDAEKLAIIDGVAGWALSLGEATVEPAAALAPELDRLQHDVAAAWPDHVDGRALIDRVRSVPGVLAHHDLGTWNVLHARGEGFTVVDWESARRPALPLWDLVYFLADALAIMPGAASTEAKLARALDVLRGQAPTSPVLYGWLDRTSTALGIPPEAVGPIVTLCWLHHGLSHPRRTAALGDVALARPPGHLPRIARPWLEDPQLGVEWRSWRSWRERSTAEASSLE